MRNLESETEGTSEVSIADLFSDEFFASQAEAIVSAMAKDRKLISAIGKKVANKIVTSPEAMSAIANTIVNGPVLEQETDAQKRERENYERWLDDWYGWY